LDKIKLRDGYLVFEDMNHFSTVKSILQKKESSYLERWESQIGFRSFRSAYEKLLQQSEEGINIDYKDILASDDVMDINLPNLEIAKLVNNNGLIEIGNKIFQYRKDNVKIITDGDSKKIKDLDKYSQSSSEANVYVATVSHLSKINLAGRTESTLHSCAAANGSEKYGISFIEDYTVFTDDVGWIHSTYTMSIGSIKLPLGGFVVSSQLHIAGVVHTSEGDQTANSTGYNKSIHSVTVFDFLRAPSAPSITLSSASWIGSGTKPSSITLQCNIQY
jgi:hypothetical protein